MLKSFVDLNLDFGDFVLVLIGVLSPLLQGKGQVFEPIDFNDVFLHLRPGYIRDLRQEVDGGQGRWGLLYVELKLGLWLFIVKLIPDLLVDPFIYDLLAEVQQLFVLARHEAVFD